MSGRHVAPPRHQLAAKLAQVAAGCGGKTPEHAVSRHAACAIMQPNRALSRIEGYRRHGKRT
jgi:hypothetical protein